MKSSTFISFQNFNDFLIETLQTEIPNSNLIIINGSDFMQDTVMEIRQQNKKLRYEPYKLYKQGCISNNFEEIIYNLVNEFKTLK